jgi:sugar phosphate isomerase/epimerase
MAGLPLTSTVAAVAPPRRSGGSHLKPALNAFSFLEKLSANAKDPAQGIDLFQLCDFCAEHGFDAVDLTGYFFKGYPGVPEDDYVFAIKRRAFDLGLAISGTGVRNDFTTADAAVRAEGVRRIQDWIGVAAKLGAPVIRVFVDCQAPYKTWQEASGRASRDEVEAWMVTAIRECAAHAARFGVIVGLQNHGDFVSTGEQHLHLLQRVDHPWCSAIVDTGKYVTPDPYADIALMAPYACNWQIKEAPSGTMEGPRTDMKRLVTLIRRSGYRGYLPLETLAMGRKDYDASVEVPKLLAELRAALAATEDIAPDKVAR